MLRTSYENNTRLPRNIISISLNRSMRRFENSVAIHLWLRYESTRSILCILFICFTYFIYLFTIIIYKLYIISYALSHYQLYQLTLLYIIRAILNSYVLSRFAINSCKINSYKLCQNCHMCGKPFKFRSYELDYGLTSGKNTRFVKYLFSRKLITVCGSAGPTGRRHVLSEIL